MTDHAAGAPLRILIVDDEPLGRDALRLAAATSRNVEIVGECGSGAEAIEAIALTRPDIILLDIRMPEVDGFAVLRGVNVEHRPIVIFVTASDEHARHAFDVHALDYVLKPFDDERLHRAVDRAREQLTARRLQTAAGEIQMLLGAMGAMGPQEPIERIAVRSEGGAYFLRTDEIDYIEASGNYVMVHVDGTAHKIRATLRGILSRLDARRFCRIHKSIIVNVDRVKAVNPWMGGDYIVVLANSIQLRASRTHVGELLRPFR